VGFQHSEPKRDASDAVEVDVDVADVRIDRGVVLVQGHLQSTYAAT
jgi:hypothetical protein